MKRTFLHSVIPLLLVLLFIISSCKKENATVSFNTSTDFILTSGLEETLVHNEDTVFRTSQANFFLQGGAQQTTEKVRNGNYALRLDNINEYGLGLRLGNLKKGTFLRMSVWMHNTSTNASLSLSLRNDHNEVFKKSIAHSYTVTENEWVKHHIAFTIPFDAQTLDLSVFTGSSTSFIDDFSLEILQTLPQNGLKKQLSIFIPDSSQNKLNKQIKKALQYEIIPSSTKKYIKASLINETDTNKIEMKLKGDWSDHLKSSKVSYRIKTKNKAFDGLLSFSIQHAATRNYIHEWVAHQMAEKLDILTTDYDFINVVINDLPKGVYAMEEHFDKQLLESRARREGPILKFDETGQWALIKKLGVGSNLETHPYFEASLISVFKKNRTRKSTQLSQQFKEGKKLLHLFKNGHLAISDLFDLEHLAKFYALMEITGGAHGLRWHNRRFYYNPITQKLEHIAYDLIPFEAKGYRCNIIQKLYASPGDKSAVFDNTILYNKEFKQHYINHLTRMSQPEYLDSLFASLSGEIKIYETALKGENKDYTFEQTNYYDNARYLRSWLPYIDTAWTNKIANKNVVDWTNDIDYEIGKNEFALKEISLNAYRKMVDSSYETLVENYDLNAIIIYAYGTSEGSSKIIHLPEPIALNAFTDYSDTVIIKTDLKPKTLYFTTKTHPEIIIKKAITKWEAPSGMTARMELSRNFKKVSPFYTVRKNNIYFSGNVVINELLYLPRAYEVNFAAGTTVTFENGGGIIINNQLNAMGTAQHPIRITCTDSSSNGITILNGGTANLNHVNCNGLGSLNYKNWTLTGAITIYETDANINYCHFSNNNSEDALNIIRSEFVINNLTVINTFSDGFDADFCEGSVNDSEFKNTGNDCLDFSGSTINLTNVSIENSGDKGISGGEASTLTLDNITISNAVIGIAAKDASFIIAKKITLKECAVGFAAFQKKPEYGGATIQAENIQICSVTDTTLIEYGSSILFNANLEKGNATINLDSLYAPFQ